MSGAYERAVSLTMRLEGGWYPGTDARDPNPTMHGITQRVYDSYRQKAGTFAQSVRAIGRDELADLYRTYWLLGHCEAIAPEAPLLAIAHFDCVFNTGPGRGQHVGANHLLQRTVGTLDDGIVGPKTLAAVRYLVGRHGDKAVTHDLLVTRRTFLESIMRARPALRGNRTGWRHRLRIVADDLGLAPLDFTDPLWGAAA